LDPNIFTPIALEIIKPRRAAMEKRWLSFDELLERYPFKPWTVRTYCSQGKIPHVKVGRRVYFCVETIEKWLQDQARAIEEVNIG
jgi:hypothetical protein